MPSRYPAPKSRIGTRTTIGECSLPRPSLDLYTQSMSAGPVHDSALSHAILRRVAAGHLPETLRLYVPDPALAFSLLDTRRPGFGRASECARQRGYAPVLRLGGGRAAVFHRRCLAFSWATPDPEPRAHIRARFEGLAESLRNALRRLGVDARVGPVPGEYCPGDHSVNASGRTKLVGIAQRVIRGAAHLGGIIVVGNSREIRRILEPVYQYLELDWLSETVGAVEDEIGPITLEEVRDELIEEIESSRSLETATVSAETQALAQSLTAWHDPDLSVRPASTATDHRTLKTLTE